MISGRSSPSLGLAPCLGVKGVRDGSSQALLGLTQGPFKGIGVESVSHDVKDQGLFLPQEHLLRPSVCKVDGVARHAALPHAGSGFLWALSGTLLGGQGPDRAHFTWDQVELESALLPQVKITFLQKARQSLFYTYVSSRS